MDELNVKLLYDYYNNKLRSVKSRFKRFLYNEINWDSRMIGIVGARGVGKTTMLIQRIKEEFPDTRKALYVSLDQIWFYTNTLYALAQYVAAHGITHLFLDEVHRYKFWSQELKMIYDTLPDLNIVYTGSSILEINKNKADLSRRQTLYHLPGLSFREFLNLEGVEAVPQLTLGEIIENHQAIAIDITSQIKILPQFEKYQVSGYYPFYKDAKRDYLTRLAEVAHVVLEIDLPAVVDVEYETIEKAKRLFAYIAGATPFEPNLADLFRSVGVSRDSGLMLLNALAEADMLALLTTKKLNYKNLVIPQKILLQNANLMHALSLNADIGAAREAFFLNQINVRHRVMMPRTGDFMVDDKYLFDVGGPNKKFNQIADMPDSFLVIDRIETGYANHIPLWMFGLMY